MMYFCPCPCNSAIDIDPEVEESTFLALPRNLSYVQESYLDRHSVSAHFVHNPKAELAQQLEDKRLYHQNQHPNTTAVDCDWEEGLDEDEKKVGLLNIVQSQQFPVCCSSPTSLRESSAPIPVTTSPQTHHKLHSPDGAALASPGTGSFMSRVAASRLASFLSPKEEPSSSSSFLANYDRDFSSSVDQPPPPEPETEFKSFSSNFDAIPSSSSPASDPPQILRSPDHRGLKMDRGEDVMCPPNENATEMISPTIVPLTSSSPTEISSLVGKDNPRDPEEDEVVAYVVEDTGVTKLTEGVDIGDEKNGMAPSDTIKSIPPSGKTMYPGKDHKHHNPSLSTPLTLTTSDKEHASKGQGQTTNSYESPDSDAFSEEGVFVNMMDDLDTTEKSTTVSEVSDDTCVSVDSMFLSPDEEELEDQKSDEKSEQPRMSVEEAISRAASDLSKMSMLMYPNILGSPLLDAAAGKTDSQRRLARESPVRQSKDLTIHLSYENISSQSSSKNNFEPPESPVYEEYEFNFSRKGLRKSSSLKTNKTPPGTPHRKKVVRFADAMGLDLETVRHVLNMESPPRIPPSAMADLKQGLGEDRKDVGPRFLCPCFTQPGATDGFVSRVIRQKISLENAIVTDLTITGFVRVANVSYHKSVRVRYTHNAWATFHDIAASYVQNSCDGPTDRFSFSIVAPAYFVAGNRLEFAVSFNADGNEYWDNNGGANYAFECFAKPVPTDNESAWMHFL